MVRLIFSYGTLMRGGVYEDFLGARRDVGCLGPARCRGTLYDLGPYPGLVATGSTWVAGELYRCPAIEEILASLDDLEGPDFGRQVLPVRWRQGPSPAWVYVYTGSLYRAAVIRGGSWKSWTRRSQAPPDPGKAE